MQLHYVKLKCFLVVVALMATLSGAAEARLRIVTTTPSLASVAQAVGGQHVEVRSLSLASQDPHFVDARPNLVLELAKADLLLVVGLGLEAGWLPTLLKSCRNAKVQPGASGHLDASTLVSLLDVPKGKVDRSMGDVHPGGNPHYMYDPRRVAKLALGIRDRLSKLDPARAESYAANALAFTQKIAGWRQHWEKKLAHLRGKRVISYHKSLSYVADWLGFEVIMQMEPKPGIPPTPGHVAQVIQIGKAQGVRLLIQESYHPKKTSELVAQKIGAKLAVVPAGPDFQGHESYLGFVNRYVELIERSSTP